jgi:hypothetical protein
MSIAYQIYSRKRRHVVMVMVMCGPIARATEPLPGRLRRTFLQLDPIVTERIQWVNCPLILSRLFYQL